MGAGIQSGGLAGGPAQASSVVAPAGQSAVISGPLGAGATDVVTKAGSTASDASVNATAELLRVGTGIGGTEVGRMTVLKGSAATGFVVSGVGAGGNLTINASTGSRLDFGSIYVSINSAVVNLSGIRFINGGTGEITTIGTDSTGTPGNATINKPSGKSAIAIGAATVTITNSLCAITSRLMVTFHARDATGLLPVAVPGAGSFTVTTVGNCTAALPFSWEVNTVA
jgi:hypothetical protein